MLLFSTSLTQHIPVFCPSVHSDPGGGQAGPRPEVGRQRDQVRQRNQGWQDGHGKTDRTRSHSVFNPNWAGEKDAQFL